MQSEQKYMASLAISQIESHFTTIWPFPACNLQDHSNAVPCVSTTDCYYYCMSAMWYTHASHWCMFGIYSQSYTSHTTPHHTTPHHTTPHHTTPHHTIPYHTGLLNCANINRLQHQLNTAASNNNYIELWLQTSKQASPWLLVMGGEGDWCCTLLLGCRTAGVTSLEGN